MLKTLFGDPNKRKIKKYQPDIVEINLLEEDFLALSDRDLQAKTGEFKQRLEKGASLDDLLPEAFAAVREASRRVLGRNTNGCLRVRERIGRPCCEI